MATTVDGLRITMIGVGNLMEMIWPAVRRVAGGDDVSSRLLGVTLDRADIPRKQEFFGFEVMLEDNLGALRRNRPDIIMFSPPPTAAPELIESALRPYFDECRRTGRTLPDIYAFPPVPLGQVYLDALGQDVLVANIIPNNVTTVGGRRVVDEGHFVCTYPAPWPHGRINRLRQLFEGQGAYIELEPEAMIPMLGGACTISSLWYAVPAIAELVTTTTQAPSHNDVGRHFRREVRRLTGFTPARSTPVPENEAIPSARFLDVLIRSWHEGVGTYFAEVGIGSAKAATLLARGFDLVLHTIQVEPREVLEDLAVGAATKGGVLERAIRSVREDILPLIETGVAAEVDDAWGRALTAAVRETAHTVRRHGLTLAG